MPLQFDSDLEKVKNKLLRMGSIAERMIRDMNSILIDRNTERLSSVFENEKKLDSLQMELDDETIKLITVYTPVAADLRLILMITRINAEIERIGDKVVDIGHHVENFLHGNGKSLKKIMDFSHVAAITEKMLHDALNAFLTRSVDQAMSVINSDDEVDRITDQTFRILFTYMLENPQMIGYLLGLMLSAQAMERIADHAVNIAEDVVFMVKGEDLRHTLEYDKEASGQES